MVIIRMISLHLLRQQPRHVCHSHSVEAVSAECRVCVTVLARKFTLVIQFKLRVKICQKQSLLSYAKRENWWQECYVLLWVPVFVAENSWDRKYSFPNGIAIYCSRRRVCEKNVVVNAVAVLWPNDAIYIYCSAQRKATTEEEQKSFSTHHLIPLFFLRVVAFLQSR